MRELLASMQIAAANGLLFVEDADTSFRGSLDVGDAPVVATDEVVLVKVVHAVDGLVSVAVVESDGETDLKASVFEGEILVSNGRLRVRDVPEDNILTVGIDPGPCRVRIAVDDPAYPQTVEILVPPL